MLSELQMQTVTKDRGMFIYLHHNHAVIHSLVVVDFMILIGNVAAERSQPISKFPTKSKMNIFCLSYALFITLQTPPT